MNNYKAIILVLAELGCLVLWVMFISVVQCHADGGTTVRGLVWLECIK